MLDLENDIIAMAHSNPQGRVLTAVRRDLESCPLAQKLRQQGWYSPRIRHEKLQLAFLARFILAWCSFLCKQHVGLECVSACDLHPRAGSSGVAFALAQHNSSALLRGVGDA